MIEFEHQTVAGLQNRCDVRCDIACIGEQAQGCICGVKQKLAGLSGVVGYREGCYMEVAQGPPARVGINRVRSGQLSVFRTMKGAWRHPYRQSMTPGQGPKPPNMVGMFMGNDYGIQGTWLDMEAT
jgi:hypothetical protein